MQPIGINFLPSDEQAANGPRQGNMEGDLGAAYKILSLQLPRRPSIGGIAPQALLDAPGSQGLPSGMNPLAAVFEALLRGLRPPQGGQPGGSPGAPPMAIPRPVVRPGGDPILPSQPDAPYQPPAPTTPTGPSIPGRPPGTVFPRRGF